MCKYLKKAIRLLALDVPEYVYHVSPFAAEILSGGFKIDPSKTTLGAFGEAKTISVTTLENARNYKAGIMFLIGVVNGELDWPDIEEIAKTYTPTGFDGALSYTMREDFSEFWSVIDEREKPFARRDRGESPLGFDWDALEKKLLPDKPWGMRHSDYFKTYQGEQYLKDIALNEINFDGTILTKEQNLTRKWRWLKAFVMYTEELPAIIGYDPPVHLQNRKMDDVGIVESRVVIDNLTTYNVNIPYELTKSEPLSGKVTWHSGEQEWRFYDPSDLKPVRIVE